MNRCARAREGMGRRHGVVGERQTSLRTAALRVAQGAAFWTILGAAVSLPVPLRAQSLPTWVSNLSTWQWYQIPNTALSSVPPNPVPPGATGPQSKIVAWCGASLKRQGSVYILGAAGGHADYAGNEVDALQLNTATPRWSQLHASTPQSQMIDASQFYLDYRPSATHTYYASQFINARNRLLVMPSGGMDYASALPPPPSGWPYPRGGGYSYSFNMATNDWDPPEYVSFYSGGGDFTAALCTKHPITEDIYYNRYPAGWWRWNQASNTWTHVNGNNNPAGNYSGAAIDPTRNRMLVLGSYSGSYAPSVLDLNGNRLTVSFGGLGASALTLGPYPGVVYDEGSDQFLVIFNSGSSVKVRRINPSTWYVDEPTTTGTAPAARQNGIQNAAQYVPELGGIVLANTYSGNVYFMRTSATVVSDTTPPSPTRDLRPR
jgi:hypothetical protein